VGAINTLNASKNKQRTGTQRRLYMALNSQRRVFNRNPTLRNNASPH